MTDRSPPLRAVRIEPKCPTCGKPADPKYKPFCRKRCADIDLGRWLKEGYRVETAEAPGEEDPDGPSSGGGSGASGHRG
jgi:hypothetical protein